jgi:hypothetical protein
LAFSFEFVLGEDNAAATSERNRIHLNIPKQLPSTYSDTESDTEVRRDSTRKEATNFTDISKNARQSRRSDNVDRDKKPQKKECSVM